MLYSLKKEQLDKIANSHLVPDFPNADMIFAIFETDRDIVREILPHPLKPSADVLGIAFVGKYPETNFNPRYNEGALLLKKTEAGSEFFQTQ